MAASRDPIRFICTTSGVDDSAAFCSAVATSLEAALGRRVVLAKEVSEKDSPVAARLEFTVSGRSGKALMETGKIIGGKFIAENSETTGVQSVDTNVERGAPKLIANLLASRMHQ